MKRHTNFWGIPLALMLGMWGLLLGSPVHAQETASEEELSRDWTLRAGIWIANQESTRSAVGDVGFSGAISRRVYTAPTYILNVGIGYDGLDTVYSIPIMLDLIAHKDNLRYGLGVGYEFGKRISGRGTSGAEISLILGYQLTHTTNPLSLDLRYNFTTGNNNELDGYSLDLGYHF